MAGDERDPAHDPDLARLDEQLRSHGARRPLDEALRRAEHDLVEAGQAVVAALPAVTEAFLRGDAGEAGGAIAAGAVEARCRAVEEECLVTLARQAPVASDLRRVLAVQRGAEHVRRAGALLEQVADAAAFTGGSCLMPPLALAVRELADRAGALLAASVEAWAADDPLAGPELERGDDEVDLLQRALFAELYTGGTGSEAVGCALVARAYERIADHAVALARALSPPP